MTNQSPACELCSSTGGDVVQHGPVCRVVLVADADYPGFCRIIWNEHVREMTDLSAEQRDAFMQTVWQVEAAVREVMAPVKVNVASLGNQTPHLHWHVIPRFADDAHFPSPVWAAPVRTADPAVLAARMAMLPSLRAAIVRHTRMVL